MSEPKWEETEPLFDETSPIEESETSTPKSGLGKVWDAIKIPEQKSREGLKMTADVLSVEPTGNAFRDVALNVPSIAADTLSEVAPGFISRGSMLTAGSLAGLKFAAPAINSAGRFIGRTAESTSGLSYKTPGVLAETVENPALLFGKGMKKARESYKAIQDSDKIRKSMKTPQNMNSFIEKAWNAAKRGRLTPDEALEARKAIDDVGDAMPDIVRKSTRKIFDAIAKKKFADADRAYSQAIKSEAIRSFWGINKSGTPSIVKGGLTTALPLTAPMFSPVVQGATAAGIGVGKKIAMPLIRNPRVGLFAGQLRDDE